MSRRLVPSGVIRLRKSGLLARLLKKVQMQGGVTHLRWVPGAGYPATGWVGSVPSSYVAAPHERRVPIRGWGPPQMGLFQQPIGASRRRRAHWPGLHRRRPGAWRDRPPPYGSLGFAYPLAQMLLEDPPVDDLHRADECPPSLGRKAHPSPDAGNMRGSHPRSFSVSVPPNAHGATGESQEPSTEQGRPAS